MGGDPLSLRFHRPEASRQGGGRARNDLSPDWCALVSRGRVCRSPDRLVVAVPTGSVRAAAQDVGTEAQRESGKKLYLKYCSQCHGEKGDGEGYATPHLRPRPRDFTTGKFKVRTTPTGALPTHQDLVNIIRRGMPYTSMPAWPNSSDQEVSDLAHFITTFSPDFSNPENVPKPVPLPSAPDATKESDRAREEALRRDRLHKVPRHARSGRRTFGANLDGRLGPSDTPGGPRAELDVPGRVVPRGYLPDDDHGVQRHAHAVVRSTPCTPEQRWAITDYIVSLSGSNGPGYSNLVVAKHVQDPIDLAKGAASFDSAPCGSLSDHRADHGARTLVPSTRDQRHRSGDLRCGLHRPARSMARHERAENREERAVASRATGGGGGSGCRASGRGWCERGRGGEPIRRRGSRADAGRSGSLCRGRGGASRSAIRVLRRRLDPDSFAGAGGRPQALLHLRRRPELGGSLVLRSGPPRSPSVHRQGKRGHRSQRHGRSHRCRELRPGRMVGHLQAAPSRNLGRPVLARRVHAGRLLGLGRVLARAWQQARSHGLVLPLRRAGSGPIGRRPDGEDGAVHSRHRAGRDRLGAVALRLSRPRGARR